MKIRGMLIIIFFIFFLEISRDSWDMQHNCFHMKHTLKHKIEGVLVTYLDEWSLK